jgi:hypothetical protein
MDGKSIKEITDIGLMYQNEYGEQVYIEFSACHQNHIEWNTSSDALRSVKDANHMTDDDLPEFIQDLQNWKVVADRNFDGFPDSTKPYIEFYTKPRIRFEFTTRDEFEQVRRAIHKAGWKTFDIT